MFQNLTGWHALIILAVVVLIFGAAKLPALARSVGQSMRILKNESQTPASESPASGVPTDEVPASVLSAAEPAPVVAAERVAAERVAARAGE